MQFITKSIEFGKKSKEKKPSRRELGRNCLLNMTGIMFRPLTVVHSVVMFETEFNMNHPSIYIQPVTSSLD